MSPELSKSRPNPYRRLRGSLAKGFVVSRVKELDALHEATLELVAQALEARDPVVARHSARVAELAARLGEQLGLGRRDVEVFRQAGMLHDLGVIGVRDDILNKRGPLDEDEWEVVRRHPDIGADMIRWHPSLAAATPHVRHPHERWDGSGYPVGLRGDVIPMGARIVAVAESFDTITNQRIYRPSQLTPVDAMRDISEHSGSWYDPTVVDALSVLHP
jgi:HD-GYP domain-containing protein (c-di-GMP phosphodiesterase class II)